MGFRFLFQIIPREQFRSDYITQNFFECMKHNVFLLIKEAISWEWIIKDIFFICHNVYFVDVQ